MLLTIALPSLASRFLIGFFLLWVVDWGISRFCFRLVQFLLPGPLVSIMVLAFGRPWIFIVHCPFRFSVFNSSYCWSSSTFLFCVARFWCSLSMSFLDVHFVYLLPLLHHVGGSFWLGADYLGGVLVVLSLVMNLFLGLTSFYLFTYCLVF